jgi:hypothetical protein
MGSTIAVIEAVAILFAGVLIAMQRNLMARDSRTMTSLRADASEWRDKYQSLVEDLRKVALRGQSVEVQEKTKRVSAAGLRRMVEQENQKENANA